MLNTLVANLLPRLFDRVTAVGTVTALGDGIAAYFLDAGAGMMIAKTFITSAAELGIALDGYTTTLSIIVQVIWFALSVWLTPKGLKKVISKDKPKTIAK